MPANSTPAPLGTLIDHAQDVRNALGLAAPPIMFRNQEWHLLPLDLFDVAALLQQYGSLEEINLESDIEATIFIASLILRKSDPSLSPSDRDQRRYRLTPAAVAGMFPLSEAGPEQIAFLSAIKAASGLYDRYPGEDNGRPAKNAERVEIKKPRQRSTRGAASSASSESAAG